MAATLNDFDSLCFVDLETTGTRAGSDRITEIAMVRTEGGAEVARWSSLIDPETPIPEQIVQITGINDEMVRDAPSFAQVLPDVLQMLDGAALVAHNAAFDAGFLRHAFKRRGVAFESPVLCTLKLSRALYPRHKRHGLDALIPRFDLQCRARHRAMGDAELLPQLLDKIIAEHGLPTVEGQWDVQLKRASLPSYLDAELLDRLPRGPGVYLFYDDKGAPLYVGKSVDIRSRVMSHFSNAKRSDKSLRMSQAVRDVRWESCAGELSALLREAELIKQVSPVFNRQLRRHRHLFSWHWQLEQGAPQLLDLTQTPLVQAMADQYGLYRTQHAAEKALREKAQDAGLCLKTLGLEKGKGPCFAYQLKKCRGACVGEESGMQHGLRVAQALMPLQLVDWPYPGAVGVREENPQAGLAQTLVLDQWRVLAQLADDEVFSWEGLQGQSLDLDTYKILQRYLRSGKAQLVPLPEKAE